MPTLEESFAERAESVRRDRPKHPAGWEPGTAWNGRAGTVTTQAITGKPDWSQMLRDIDLDPEQVEVIEPVEWRTWDAAIGNGEVRKMRYWKARIQARRGSDAVPVAELLRHVKRQRTPGPARTDTAVRAFHLSLNDWQIGKEGTAKAVQKIRDGYADAEAYLRRLRAERTIDAIYLDCVGDLHEGCRDHYPSQSYTVEYDNRDQGIIVRKLVLEGIDRFRRLAPVVVPAVGGNHGEERSDGQAYTGPGDNRDVASVETVAEICAANPSVYGNVSFLIPRDELVLTFDAAGTIVALAHGHKIPNRADVVGSIQDWWKGQMYGRRAAGDADLILTAHRHKFLWHQDGHRALAIAPTVDAGSRWYADKYGIDSAPAMLAFTTSGGGWDDMRLL